MFGKPERESNRSRRQTKRNISRQIRKSRKAGTFNTVAEFDMTTKYAANLNRRWHSSGNFRRWYQHKAWERSFYDDLRYADY